MCQYPRSIVQNKRTLTISFSWSRTVKATVSMFLVLQILGLMLLAACPELHHAIHPDSDQPDHQCLVTMFAQGQIDAPEVTLVVMLVTVVIFGAARLPQVMPRVAIPLCAASPRAPPTV